MHPSSHSFIHHAFAWCAHCWLTQFGRLNNFVNILRFSANVIKNQCYMPRATRTPLVPDTQFNSRTFSAFGTFYRNLVRLSCCWSWFSNSTPTCAGRTKKAGFLCASFTALCETFVLCCSVSFTVGHSEFNLFSPFYRFFHLWLIYFYTHAHLNAHTLTCFANVLSAAKWFLFIFNFALANEWVSPSTRSPKSIFKHRNVFGRWR